MRLGRVLGVGALAVIAIVIVLGALVAWLNVRGEDDVAGSGSASGAGRDDGSPRSGVLPDAALVARGAYLIRAGNCQGCHTDRGGQPFAGGRAIETPFGAVVAPNLTPDARTGLGSWSADDFWRALHHGRSKDGRLLYPAFPYPNYTRVSRADADAMFAALRGLAPVSHANQANTLAFPFDTQVALAVWRALFFRAAPHVDDPARTAAWNRGAYLVEGLGHCNACHSARNAFGATAGPLDLQGGLIPVQNWYAPSLASPHEAGVAGWSAAEVVRLLKTGVAAQGFVAGPMSEVVGNGTQYLSDADLGAVATYLQSLPPPPEPAMAASASRVAPNAHGVALYKDHCAACHGDHGEGVPGAYPALSGSRAVTMRSTANLVHVVLEGGFPPSTAGNPRPFGMPPFAIVLSDADVADLLSAVRGSWGNDAPPVSAFDVARTRNGRQ